MVRFALSVALALVAFAPRAEAGEPFKMMSADEVESMLGKPGVHVFDVNTPERWEQGRLPGATHVSTKNVAEHLPPNKEATLIFYCTNPK